VVPVIIKFSTGVLPTITYGIQVLVLGLVLLYSSISFQYYKYYVVLRATYNYYYLQSTVYLKVIAVLEYNATASVPDRHPVTFILRQKSLNHFEKVAQSKCHFRQRQRALALSRTCCDRTRVLPPIPTPRIIYHCPPLLAVT
jgi:hypothetical protein